MERRSPITRSSSLRSTSSVMSLNDRERSPSSCASSFTVTIGVRRAIPGKQPAAARRTGDEVAWRYLEREEYYPRSSQPGNRGGIHAGPQFHSAQLHPLHGSKAHVRNVPFVRLEQ